MQPFNPNTLPSVLKNIPLASSTHCPQQQVDIENNQNCVIPRLVV